MSFVVQAEAPPLREEGDGALRIGNSRVLLEIVIEAFEEGATPEAIVQQYPTVSLSDVYAVVAYYLRHKAEVEAYLEQRGRKAEEVHEKIAARQGDLHEIRQRLQTRRNA